MNRPSRLPQRQAVPVDNTHTAFHTKYFHRQWDTLLTQLRVFRIASTTWEHIHIHRALRSRMGSNSPPPDTHQSATNVGLAIVHLLPLADSRNRRLFLSDLFECDLMSSLNPVRSKARGSHRRFP